MQSAAASPRSRLRNKANIIFRIPTPAFGAGLIEAIPDSTILNNKSDDAGNKALRGISGHENRDGNTGTVTRFGWKAQNKSLDIFGGEAYNVEQGVTNEVFPNERDETAGCQFNGIPEDHTTLAPMAHENVSDVIQFGMFMRFLAPPTPAPAERVDPVWPASVQPDWLRDVPYALDEDGPGIQPGTPEPACQSLL